MLRSNKITLIYANCHALRGGDFTIAGEIAYALQMHYNDEMINAECYLTSTRDGLTVLNNFYNGKANALTIHGTVFTAMAFNDYLNHANAVETINYIHVGCEDEKESSIMKLKTIAPQMQVNVALLPHYTKREAGYYSQRYSNFNPCLIRLGFMSSIGCSTHIEPMGNLDHNKYHQVTREPFTLAYFLPGGPAEDFLFDFIKLNSKFRSPITQFVIIGNSDTAEDAAFRFLRTRNTAALIIDEVQKIKTLFFYDKTIGQHTAKVMPITDDAENEANRLNIQISFRFLLVERVSRDEMHKLMTSAVPLISATGVSSTLEAIALGKIVFYQNLNTNIEFYANYIAKVLSHTPTNAQKYMCEVLECLAWNDPYTDARFDALSLHLPDIYDFLSEVNKKLTVSTKEYGSRIAAWLQTPSRVSGTLFHRLQAKSTVASTYQVNQGI